MIGTTISHYRILEKLGAGGMGVVYKAKDTKLDRTVALKFLPPHMHLDEEAEKRFISEAKAASSFDHNNICTIYEIDKTNDDPATAGGQLFIAMACYEGETLKSKLKNGKLKIKDVIDISSQIAEGLNRAHKKGIVHRDIKPANIFITNDGIVKILDFGLAKVSSHTQITTMDSTSGTIAYMSPEQTRGGLVDQRTDIWSLGVVMYEMLTGELPFKGDYDQAIIYSILNEEPQPVNKIEERNSIQHIVKKALEKDPEKRYEKIADLIDDLKSKDVSYDKSGDGVVKKIKKIAVLPFSNLLQDPQTDFLGFALADQIIGAMAYSKNMLIRPSSAVRKYQNDIVDIQKVGSELNVDYVLVGNYLKEADTIRLNMELIDLESQNMIWREPIQIEYKNVFELQDIVSQKVVDGLKIQFSNEERERMKPDAPKNPVAYEFYLHAVAYPHTIEGTGMALKMLNNSISLDPAFAPSYLELGIRNHQLSQVGSNTSEAFENAEKALIKALSLKSDFLPALATLALIYTDIGKHIESNSLLMKALEINPNDAWLHFSLGYHYRYIGFLEESEREINTALSIDPDNPRFRSSIVTYMFLGKYEEVLNSFNLDSESPYTLNYLGEIAFRNNNRKLSREYFERVLKIKDEIGEFYFASSFVEYMNGNIEKAAEFNLKRELENPNDSEIWYEIARVYGLCGKKEDCYRALKKSIDMGYVSFPSMQIDSFLDSVREDPAIKDLLSEARTKYEALRKKLSTIY